MLTRRNFYINGQWVAPAKARDCQVINPSNEEPCAVISLGDQIAGSDASIMITGESGVGKSLILQVAAERLAQRVPEAGQE